MPRLATPGIASQTVSAKTMIVVMKRELLHRLVLLLGEEQQHDGRHRGQEDDQAHQHGGVVKRGVEFGQHGYCRL